MVLGERQGQPPPASVPDGSGRRTGPGGGGAVVSDAIARTACSLVEFGTAPPFLRTVTCPLSRR